MSLSQIRSTKHTFSGLLTSMRMLVQSNKVLQLQSSLTCSFSKDSRMLLDHCVAVMAKTMELIQPNAFCWPSWLESSVGWLKKILGRANDRVAKWPARPQPQQALHS